MEEKKYEKFLPLGTVVRLKNGKLPVMIIGYTTIVKDKIYDYNATFFPMGTIDTSIITPFNHKQIEEVLFKGYETEESKDYIESVKKIDTYARLTTLVKTKYEEEK